MKQINKDTEILLLRINDFQNYNFVDEHIKCLNDKGIVWMLKAGRHLSEKSVKIIMDSGIVLLKEQKKSGNRFFAATVGKVCQGKRKEDMVFPSYYSKLPENGLLLEGTWIEMHSMRQLDQEALDQIVLAKDDQKIVNVVNRTRAPILYCKSMETIKI